MSTHKRIDRICVVVIVCALLLTLLFMNGEKLGIQIIADEDAEGYAGEKYFTANDLAGDWDASSATRITLQGDTAQIAGNGAYSYGGDVYISEAGRYQVSGVLEDGSLIVDAHDSSKVWILLDGAEISCADDAGIQIRKADKVFLTLAEGSENAVASGAMFSEEAESEKRTGAIFAKDDLTINGSGSLQVTAAYRHGIVAKDELVITGGTICVEAVADGIHVNDTLAIQGTELRITAGDDGLVQEKEDGYFYLESGGVTIDSADDGIHSASDVILAGGDLEIAAGDDGIHSDTRIHVQDGTVNITECYEGLEAVVIDISGGDIAIHCRDDGLNANGNAGFSFGGMQPPGNSEGESEGDSAGRPAPQDGQSPGGESAGEVNGGAPGQRPEGTDGESAGEANGGAPGQSPEGESDGEAPGESPDGESAPSEQADGEAEETYITISGGTITIINETARDADGLDSNGSIYISGGTIRISLVSNGSNSAIDYGSENGGVCEISGGTLLAAGSSAMAEQFSESSAQCAILYTMRNSVAAGTEVSLRDADGAVLLNWEIPCSFSALNLSCPELEVGETYTLILGEQEETITLEDVSSAYGDSQGGSFGGPAPRF